MSAAPPRRGSEFRAGTLRPDWGRGNVLAPGRPERSARRHRVGAAPPPSAQRRRLSGPPTPRPERSHFAVSAERRAPPPPQRSAHSTGSACWAAEQFVDPAEGPRAEEPAGRRQRAGVRGLDPRHVCQHRCQVAGFPAPEHRRPAGRRGASARTASSVTCSQPLSRCEPALPASRSGTRLSSSTPWSAQALRSPWAAARQPRSICSSL